MENQKAEPKYFISDVDGVLTDGSFIYSAEGKMFKTFGPHDSDGIKLLKKHTNLHIRFITADKRGYAITERRIQDMNCNLEYVPEERRYSHIQNLGFHQVIYVGDGVYDAPILRNVLHGIAPANALPIAKVAANYVTTLSGGEGVLLNAAMNILAKFYPDQYREVLKSWSQQ